MALNKAVVIKFLSRPFFLPFIWRGARAGIISDAVRLASCLLCRHFNETPLARDFFPPAPGPENLLPAPPSEMEQTEVVRDDVTNEHHGELFGQREKETGAI